MHKYLKFAILYMLRVCRQRPDRDKAAVTPALEA